MGNDNSYSRMCVCYNSIISPLWPLYTTSTWTPAYIDYYIIFIIILLISGPRQNI